MSLESFIEGYIECALWSSTDDSRDDGGDPLEDNYSADDLAEQASDDICEMCEIFYKDHRKLWLGEISDEQAGHDFWLTRNRHGAGFWDRGLKNGDTLTEAAHAAGSSDLYVGDDGKLYVL